MSKIKKTYFLLTLIITLFALIWCAHEGEDQSYFISNIVPELIGVCVELLIFIILFEQWRIRENKNNQIKVERRLREFLIFFLDKACDGLSEDLTVGRFYGSGYIENQKILNKFIEHIEQHDLTEKLSYK